MDEKKKQALGIALSQIEKQFGKGSIMRMSDDGVVVDVEAVATGSIGWLSAGSGLLLGLVIVSLLYAFAGFGGGDVKLVGTLAASVGPLGFLNLLIYIALAGGVLALVAVARKRDDFAYVPAIAVGLLAYVWRFET